MMQVGFEWPRVPTIKPSADYAGKDPQSYKQQSTHSLFVKELIFDT